MEQSYFNLTSSQVYNDFRELTQDDIRQIFQQISDIDEIEAFTNHILEKIEAPLLDFKKTMKEILDLSPYEMVSPDFQVPEVQLVSREEYEEASNEKLQLEKDYLKELLRAECLRKEEESFSSIKPMYDKTEKILEIYRNSKSEKNLEEVFNAFKTTRNLYIDKVFAENVSNQKFNALNLFQRK